MHSSRAVRRERTGTTSSPKRSAKICRRQSGASQTNRRAITRRRICLGQSAPRCGVGPRRERGVQDARRICGVWVRAQGRAPSHDEPSVLGGAPRDEDHKHYRGQAPARARSKTKLSITERRARIQTAQAAVRSHDQLRPHPGNSADSLLVERQHLESVRTSRRRWGVSSTACSAPPHHHQVD